MAALLCYSTAYSVYAVPYLAMPPEIVSGYDARTGLMAYRVMFAVIGVLIGSAGAPLLIQHYGPGGGGYAMLGRILGAVAVAAGVLAWAGTAAFPPPAMPERPAAVPFRQLVAKPFVDVVSVFDNAPFRILTLVKLLQLSVQAVALACTPYFFSFVLKMQPAAISRYLTVFTLAGLVLLPLWRQVISRFGKKQTNLWLLGAYGLGMLSWVFWAPGEPLAVFYLRALWIGGCSTGTLLCALALLPDTMEYDRLLSGRKREGVMSGVAAFVEKLASALGPFLIGILLQAMGLVTARQPDLIQPPQALLAVRLGMSVVPAVLTFACIPVLWRYRLDQATLERARAAMPAARATG